MVVRHANGVSDAEGMAAIHEARAEADSLIPGLSFEEMPSVEDLRQKLEASNHDDWVVAEDAGHIVGYGHCLYDWDEAEERRCYLQLGFVAPEFRGRGFGTEMLSRLEDRCREKAIAHNALDRSDLGANASETEVSSQELLRNSGYEIIYTAIQMDLLHFDSTQSAPIPAGYELRLVSPEHHLAIWQMIGDAYYDPAEQKRGIETGSESRFHSYFQNDPALMFVAWYGNRVAGAVLAKLENGIGEVYEVSIGHWHRRRGLARALLTRAIVEILSRNPIAVHIVTKKEFPTQAWRLYESVGFRTIKEFPRWRKVMNLL